MKKADYYINKIFDFNETDDEKIRELFDEVMAWLQTASDEEELYFANSGAGEMLYMMSA